MTERLIRGQRMPAIDAIDMDGNAANMADAVAGSWGVILFFRGHW